MQKLFQHQLVFKPDRHCHQIRPDSLRREGNIRLQQPFKFQERLVIKNDISEVLQRDLAAPKAKSSGVAWKSCVVLFAAEALLLGGSDNFPIAQQARCTVVVKSGDPENIDCHIPRPQGAAVLDRVSVLLLFRITFPGGNESKFIIRPEMNVLVLGNRSRGCPGCGYLFGNERMTGGIPMAVFWCVENLANRRCLAHRSSQRDKLDSSLLTEGRKTCLQIPRLPAQATTSRRKRTEVAIHPEFDWNVVDDQSNPMFARHVGALTQGRLR